MTTFVKVALGALGGLALGFAGGWFAHKKVSDVQFEEIEDAEMKEIEGKLQAAEQAASSLPKENKQKTDEDLPTDPDKLRMTLQGKVSYLHADQEAKEHYAKIWGTVRNYSNEDNANDIPVEEETGDVEEGFDEEFLEMIEAETVEPGQVAPPHPIDLSDFYNERNEYDKITIDWYEDQNGIGTFLDEKEEVIADLKSYFGDIDILKLFEKNGPDDDPDVRFIRNESYGTDYEIIRHHRSWMETNGIE